MMGRSTKFAKWLAIVSLAACLAQAIFEGAHWQISPEYLASIASVVVAFVSDRPRAARTILSVLVLMLDACAVVLSFLLPIFSLPRPTGTYPVGTSILYFRDASRVEDANPGNGALRELKVQLWYPAGDNHQPFARYRTWRETNRVSRYQRLVVTNSRVDAPIAEAGSPFPIILFNPAWQSRRTIDTFLTEDLASHGFVVAAIDHPYNAKLVSFPDGRVIASSSPGNIAYPDGSSTGAVIATWDAELAKWEADERFVLDRLQEMSSTPGSIWFGRMNAQNSGAVGHSFGGAAGVQICAHDARVHGAINMDGWFFGAIHSRGANQPLLVMSASSLSPEKNHSAETIADQLDDRDAADVEASLRRYGGYHLVLKGAQHDDFTDESLVSPVRRLANRGTIPAGQLQDIVRTYVLAFFDKTLRGKDPSILHETSSPFKEVSFDSWPSSAQTQQSMATLRPQSTP